MTREEAIKEMQEEWEVVCECCTPDRNNPEWVRMETANLMAIKALRYQPIILQEHDAEPRRLRAILDTVTEEIYVCRLTKQDADDANTTIEEVEE